MIDSLVSGAAGSYAEFLALGVFVLGIIGARLASVATGAGLGALDRRMARVATTAGGAISPRLIALSRALVFWLVFVFAVMVSLRLLGVGGLTGMLDALVGFIPQVLVAFAIVVAGHLLGLLAGGLFTQFYDDVSPDSLAPKLLHALFVVVAIVMGLQQIDINIAFVTQLLLIVAGVVGGGLMLAFALGARAHVANLLARRELERYKVGDRVRFENIEGSILELHDSGVDIATDEGIVSVPGARFAEGVVLRLTEGKRHGAA